MRMIYAPNCKGGTHQSQCSGLAMLSTSMTSQLSNWIVKTDAVGDEQCMTLIIAEFRFHDQDEPSRNSLKFA